MWKWGEGGLSSLGEEIMIALYLFIYRTWHKSSNTRFNVSLQVRRNDHLSRNRAFHIERASLQDEAQWIRLQGSHTQRIAGLHVFLKDSFGAPLSIPYHSSSFNSSLDNFPPKSSREVKRREPVKRAVVIIVVWLTVNQTNVCCTFLRTMQTNIGRGPVYLL